MSLEPRELRCNSCGAALHYEPGAAVITCGHCGTEYVLDAPDEAFVEFSFAEEEAEIPDVEPPAEDERPYYEAEVLSWLQRGKKVEAVRVVRARTGLGLRESKEYVEELAAREGIPLRGGGTGPCLVIVGALILIAVAGIAGFLIMAR